MRENRKYPRIRCSKNTLAEVRPYSAIVGQVMDVSLGGLGFRYMDTGNRITDRLELNLWVDGTLYMKNIPVKTISDTAIEGMATRTAFPLKRCCVQFCGLTPEQSGCLKRFFRKGTECKKGGS